jgi:hypothetical protein
MLFDIAKAVRWQMQGPFDGKGLSIRKQRPFDGKGKSTLKAKFPECQIPCVNGYLLERARILRRERPFDGKGPSMLNVLRFESKGPSTAKEIAL